MVDLVLYWIMHVSFTLYIRSYIPDLFFAAFKLGEIALPISLTALETFYRYGFPKVISQLRKVIFGTQACLIIREMSESMANLENDRTLDEMQTNTGS